MLKSIRLLNPSIILDDIETNEIVYLMFINLKKCKL